MLLEIVWGLKSICNLGMPFLVHQNLDPGLGQMANTSESCPVLVGRGRGYTPCPECGIERSRVDCSVCNGKVLACNTCSPLKVKEDDEVDNLEIKVNSGRRSKRVYQSLSPEVGLKISRSLRSLNAKTGLFSKRMKIIRRNPMLHAQRVAAIKKAKGTAAARKQASESMKAFFRDPENRRKRSIAMKGVKFHCRHCGKEGHRRHYCPELRDNSGERQFKCRLCGGKRAQSADLWKDVP